MTKFLGGKTRPLLALVLALAGGSAPLAAQDGSADNRLRRLEAEVRDLKRQAGAERTVAPQATPSTATPRPTGAPATTAVSDLMARMEAIEAQLARLTAQNEEGGNKLRLLEERVTAGEAAAKAAAAAQASMTTGPSIGQGDAVSTDGSITVTPSSARPTTARPTPAAATAPARPTRPAAATPARPAAPSAQRVAAVRAIEKPETTDAGEDEYTYGFRLWEAKFYPEAQQQLKLYLDKYPRHTRVSFARNLMGRALLSDGKPREAASWFLQNYEANKQGDRAPDSLLYLAEAMSQLKDTSRGCIALGEFAKTYPKEAAGRLKTQYDTTRATVKCD